jgi:hypothetical protein
MSDRLCSRTLVFLAMVLVACGDSASGVLPGGDGGLPGPLDGGFQDGGAPDGGSEGRVLAYTGSSPVLVYYGDSVDLGFTLRTTTNAPVSGAPIDFVLSGTGGTLASSRVLTDATGGAVARFTAGNADGEATLTASAERAASVSVQIRVRVYPTGSIRVGVSSQTRIPVGRADLSLYVAAPGAVPTCAALSSAGPLPATPYTSSLSTVPGSHQFDNLATASAVVAFVAGYNATGTLIARGCVEGAVVAARQVTSVNVVLSQLPSVLAGEYDVLQAVDLGEALPQPYDDYLDIVTRSLAYPAQVVTYYILRQIDANLGTTFLTVPGTSRTATLDEVFASPASYTTWSLVSAGLDSFLASHLGPRYGDVKSVAGSIRGLVTAFEVGNHFKLTQPGQGPANACEIDESWRAMVYTWWFGCAQGDTGCARRGLKLANTRYAPIHVSYKATISHAPLAGASPVTERFKVEPEQHDVPLSYGAVILIALEYLVYPRLGCSDCVSLGDFLGSLVNCSAVGSWLANSLPGLVDAQTATQLCTLGVQMAGTAVEDEVIALTVGGTGPHLSSVERAGIGGGGEFYLVDANQDLRTELVRDLKMYVQWRDPNNVPLTLDITAPIVGHGREAATHCQTDNDCAAAKSCQLLPSYLEIRELETTCKPAVGTTAGRQSCTQDTQCRSGLCLRAGAGTSGTCFAACTASIQCAGGICDPNRVTMSLEGVRPGLGSAPGSGCNP